MVPALWVPTSLGYLLMDEPQIDISPKNENKILLIDGRVGEVSEHINQFWRSRGKEIWSQIQYNGTKWEPPLQTLEKQQKKP